MEPLSFLVGFLLGVFLTLLISFFLFKKILKISENKVENLNFKAKDALVHESKLQLEQLLNPLRENLKDYQKSIEELKDKGIENTISLQTELKSMLEQTKRVENEAYQLTKALKGDVKVQGNWGEMILTRILDLSGLVEKREYSTQMSFKDKEGKLFRPDLIVHLPDQGHLIIDAKVSLVSYERIVNSEEMSMDLLKDLKTSFKNHVDTLSAKNYQSLNEVNSPDFVIMFIPIEKAISLLLSHEADFLEYAFKKKVIITGPFGLMPILKTVESLWRVDKQNKNAGIIAEKAGLLYDKFYTFYKDIDSVSNDLIKLQEHFEQAKNRLLDGKGALISRVEELKELGARVRK